MSPATVIMVLEVPQARGVAMTIDDALQSELQRTPPESLSDYALRAIREDLIEGRLVPGQRITTEGLAQSLQISHVPVREALRYLEAEGHLERGARSRVVVAPVTADEAEEIYRLREILEAEVHREAVPKLTEADFAALELHFAAMESALAVGDTAAFARANRRFHFVPFNRSGMKWMIRFLNIVWDAAARYQTSLFRETGWEADLQRHHRLIVDAMRRRDADAVNELMNQHRRVTVDAARQRSSSRERGKQPAT
jgi:DNA-binding GntR family transcriptional regulator